VPHGIEVDYWALGCLTYELIAGVLPFFNSNKKQMIKNILKADIQFNDKFSQHAKSFVTACLERDPTKRLGHNSDAKLHPWF